MVARRWCEPSDLEHVDVPDPQPGPDQVVIETSAPSVATSPISSWSRASTRSSRPCRSRPDSRSPAPFAAVGEGVRHVQVGQRVAALLGWGGYAERAVANATDVFPRSPTRSASRTPPALGIVYQTSYCALTHRAVRLKKGDTLLVHAAAGGVGLAAVQIGKALGARVIATAGSPAKLDIARAPPAPTCASTTAPQRTGSNASSRRPAAQRRRHRLRPGRWRHLRRLDQGHRLRGADPGPWLHPRATSPRSRPTGSCSRTSTSSACTGASTGRKAPALVDQFG